MNNSTKLKVTSHIGRDLLSSAASFKTEASVVWEYVSNSLQYVDQGVIPRILIKVFPRKKLIEIHDNGRGMDREMLGVFFKMHAENVDRLQGRPGRGKFGTGKSAAFGIANSMRIETRCNGMLNIVELNRHSIEESGDNEIPVIDLVINQPTSKPNGTSVIVSNIFLKRVREAPIVEYLERHLQAFRQIRPEVAVNDHICEFKAPEMQKQIVFEPNAKQRDLLGDVKLLVNVSRLPLSDDARGIAVTSGIGNLVGVEDCGISQKDHGNYLFGEVDVPAIESFDTPIEPFDDSRSLLLNPQHPVVKVLLGFMGSSLEKVRKELLDEYKDKRKTEVARRLASTANKIADLLNSDFNQVRDLLNEIRSSTSKTGTASSLFGSDKVGDEDEDSWIKGIDQPGFVDSSEHGNITNSETNRPDPMVPQTGIQDDSGDDLVSPIGGKGKKPKPKGGFSVDFKALGVDEDRSIYDDNTLTIVINENFPSVAAALETAGTEDPVFKRLAYEIAFTEYAMAWGAEKIKQDPDIPADDLRYEVRSTLQRVSRAAAHLYR